MTVRHTLQFALLGAATLAIAACSQTGAQSRPIATAAAPTGEFGYTVYNDVLQRYVDDRGNVNYASLKAGREGLDSFVASLGHVTASELESWPRDEQLAFWINAYNAITLKYIIDHYPIEKGGLIAGALYPANSIRQIKGVWDTMTTPVAGEPTTLDAIEHAILRKQFSEPRIHMAIVCASVGCPPLRNEAFVADRLDEQLDDQSRVFLKSPGRFRVDRDSAIVYLSPIFDWFGKDFVAVYRPDSGYAGQKEPVSASLNFVSHYVSEADAAFLRGAAYDVKFSDYDWSLNEQ